MSKFFHFGVLEDDEWYKKQAIISANKLSLILFFVAALLSFLFYKNLHELFYLPVAFMIGIALSIFCNYLGLIDLGRYSLLFFNVLFLALLNAFPILPEESGLTHLYFAQFSLILFPWVLFDLREGYSVYIAFLFVLFFFLSQSLFIESFTLEMDRSFLESTLFVNGVYVVIFASAFFLLYQILQKVVKNEQNTYQTTDEIKSKTLEMENHQRELEIKIEDINTAHKSEEERSWVAQNLTQVTDLIRSSNSKNIFPEIAAEMVRLLSAQQVAIYVIDEESSKKRFLKMEGCYAIDRVKHIEQKLNIGEGLIGQCCKDNEFIYINNLPSSHLRFKTGMGDEPPKNMAIIPLIENEKITGVAELVSHHKFEAKEREFLTQISEIIASFINSNQVNVKIKELIEQNQVQAEEMKAQEEEMMQNMEELQATQEEMSRKEKEYLEKIENLEHQLEERNKV